MTESCDTVLLINGKLRPRVRVVGHLRFVEATTALLTIGLASGARPYKPKKLIA
jgi:hypothetical protein